MAVQLVLHLKKEYFDAIKNGSKTFEYRLRTPYWAKRLVNRQYKTIRLLCGYPKQGDKSREIICRWQGYKPLIIRHPHFGKEPVRVFAIRVDDKIHVS